MTKKKPPAEANAEIDSVISGFGGAAFSSRQFIEDFEAKYPEKWSEIVDQYKIGGKDSGHRFSSSSFIGRQLDFRSDQGKLKKLPRRRAPAGWGNRWISVWQSPSAQLNTNIYPDELYQDLDIWEGAKKKIFVNKFERNQNARKKCISHYKCVCFVCKIDFSEKYGEHGSGFIHVHHLKPLHTIGKKYAVDPISDLRPVCPNCHAMIYYRGGLLSIKEVQAILRPD